jgi:hypothetical protein
MLRRFYSSALFWPSVLLIVPLVFWTGLAIHLTSAQGWNLLGCIGAGLVFTLITSPLVFLTAGFTVSVTRELRYIAEGIFSRLGLH